MGKERNQMGKRFSFVHHAQSMGLDNGIGDKVSVEHYLHGIESKLPKSVAYGYYL